MELAGEGDRIVEGAAFRVDQSRYGIRRSLNRREWGGDDVHAIGSYGLLKLDTGPCRGGVLESPRMRLELQVVPFVLLDRADDRRHIALCTVCHRSNLPLPGFLYPIKAARVVESIKIDLWMSFD